MQVTKSTKFDRYYKRKFEDKGLVLLLMECEGI